MYLVLLFCIAGCFC